MSEEIDFFHADEHESFLQIALWVLMGMVKYSQNYEISKFVISLQYVKENRKVDFLLADKHQRFVQTDNIISGVDGQACPNYPK